MAHRDDHARDEDGHIEGRHGGQGQEVRPRLESSRSSEQRRLGAWWAEPGALAGGRLGRVARTGRHVVRGISMGSVTV